MIRVIRLTFSGILVLALGLIPVGCGGEATSTSKDKNVEAGKKSGEGMKKVMEERMQKGAAGGQGAADQDKSKDDDKDK